jgi:hypothetical protein
MRGVHKLLLSGVVACAACSGRIDGPREISGSAIPGAPASSTPSIADPQMRAEDPALFDLTTQYFPGTAASGGKKRLFRLTREQIDLTTRTLLPGSYAASVSSVVPSDPLQTNYEYGDILSWNASNFTPYTGWVGEIARRVEAQPASVISCANATDTACLQLGAEQLVRRAFRNVVSTEQLARFSDFFVASAAQNGVAVATGDLVDLVLTSPSYVFREEVATDAQGVLLPAQQLQSLAYTLADAPPEALQLANDAPAAAQIDAVLQSPLARAKLMRFFVAWLEIREPSAFALAANVFPEWTEAVATAAVADTKAFLEHELSSPAPTLKTITQSTSAFASPESAFLYGAGTTATAAVSPLEVDPTQRIGIFTQPAVIASHSGPTTTRLVKRGVFFVRKIMCLPLGNPPPGVNTMLPTIENATERQRVETITANPPCSGCHTYINPFGFMQEGYDALGRVRTLDERGLAIDASSAIDFLDEGPIHAQTGVEALRQITASARFKQCFTRQMFRYYMGRDEEASDDPVLRQMFFAFAKDDRQDILSALRALATSASFAQRTEAP